MSVTLEATQRLSVPHLGRAGMVAGPLFVSIVVVVTALEWDFLHRHGWTLFGSNDIPYPSYTSLGRVGFLQVANFFVTGALLIAFVQALAAHLRGRAGTAGQVLLTLTGVGILTSSFPTDRVTGAPTSWHGWIHGISFFVIVLTSVLGLLLAGLALRREAGWQRWGTATAVLGPWQLAMFTVGGGLLRGDTGFYLFLLTFLGWVFLTGRRLSRAG